MVTQNSTLRNKVEDMFVEALRSRGNEAIASYSVLPVEQLPDKKAIASMFRNTGADSVMISSLINVDTKQTFIPTYYDNWASYHGIVVSSPGYMVVGRTLLIETKVYDLSTNKLIWGGLSKTEILETNPQLLEAFVKEMINGLAADAVIK